METEYTPTKNIKSTSEKFLNSLENIKIEFESS